MAICMTMANNYATAAALLRRELLGDVAHVDNDKQTKAKHTTINHATPAHASTTRYTLGHWAYRAYKSSPDNETACSGTDPGLGLLSSHPPNGGALARSTHFGEDVDSDVHQDRIVMGTRRCNLSSQAAFPTAQGAAVHVSTD